MLSDKTEADTLVTVSHHPTEPILLLLFEQNLYMWNYKRSELVAKRNLTRKVIKQGGFFPDHSRVWTLPVAASDSVDFGIWDYRQGTYHEYALERHDHYGRGAVLHPSGLLIGALWSTYASGYHLHRVQEYAEGLLGYYEQPAGESFEYESYCPAFSPDGRLFAFISNPYRSSYINIGRIYLYEVETAKCMASLSTVTDKYNERELQFVQGGNALAYYVDKRVIIHEQAKRWDKIVLETASPIKQVVGHPLLGLYVIVHEDEVTFLASRNTDLNHTSDELRQQSQSLHAYATQLAERFILANQASLRAVGTG